MKEQIATTLEQDNPGVARMVRSEATSIDEVTPNPLGEWQLIDVLWRGPAHPQRWFMGVQDGGARVVILSGYPERWGQVLDGVEVVDAAGAVRLAVAHADATRDMSRGYARIESVEDIRFLRKPAADAAPVIAEIRETYAQRVHSPSTTGEGPWTVELWTVTNGDLVRHEVTVETDGSVSNHPTVEVADLPVPQAL